MPDVLSDADVGLEQVLSDSDVGIESPKRDIDAERESLRSQMREARAEGIGDKALLGLADLGERAAYTASLMDPLAAVGRVINPYQQSLLPAESVRSAIDFFDPLGGAPVGSAREGAKEFASELVSGLAQPEALAAMATGKINPQLPGRLFQPGLIKGSQQAAANLAQAETPAEAVKSGLELGLAVGGTAGIEAHGAKAGKARPTDLIEPKPEVTKAKPAIEETDVAPTIKSQAEANAAELNKQLAQAPAEIVAEPAKPAEPAPVEPAVVPTEPAKPTTIQEAWTAFDDTGTVGSARELSDVVDGLIASGTKVPASVKRALTKYRKAVKEDFESHAGRGDVEPFEEKFLAEVEKAANKQGEISAEPKAVSVASEAAPLDMTPIQQAKSMPELTEAVGKLYLQATTKEHHAQLKQARDAKAVELQPELETVEIGRFKTDSEAENLVDQNVNQRSYRKQGNDYVVYEDRPSEPLPAIEAKAETVESPVSKSIGDRKSEIVSKIDELTSVARERMKNADPIMVALRPNEVDWMTHEELAKLHELKLQLPSFGEERQAAIERLKQKRAKPPASPTPALSEGKAVAKQPWEMTAEEAAQVTGLTWDRWQDSISSATKEGKLTEDSVSYKSAAKTGNRDFAKLKNEAQKQPPAQPIARAEAKRGGEKPFEVDDQLVMRSPHTGDDTLVSFRGLMPDGKAVVWTGKTQFPVPIEWLRRQGEHYGETTAIVQKQQIPNAAIPKEHSGYSRSESTKSAVSDADLQRQSTGVEKTVVQTGANSGNIVGSGQVPLKKLSKDQLFEIYRKEVPLSSGLLKSSFQKRTIKSIVEDIENARVNRQRESQELELTRQIEPEIRKLADEAGPSWRTVLNKYAKDRGWSFNPPSETTKGEYVAMLALERAKKQLKQTKSSPPPTAQPVVEPQQTKIQGMGGAIPEEFAKGQGSPTAMKYRLIDQERAKRGLEPLSKPDRVSDQAVMDKAIGEMDRNANLPDQLIQELREKPRAIEDWENHVLLLRKIELRDEYHKSAREAMQAYADSVQFPERLADMEAANARTQFYSNELTKLEEASRVAGSARGRALRALRVMANEDFSLESLEMEARAARNWQELTPDERGELIKIADEHKAKSEELQKRLDELEKAQQDKEVGTVLTDLKGEVAKNPKGAATPVDVSAAKIRKRLEKNPKADIRFFVRKIARYFVSQGTKERNMLIDQVHDVLSEIIPDLEKRTTADLISGYGDYSRLPKDTVSVILRDLSGQMQQIAKLEDMISGKSPLRSGQERRTPSDVERILQKQVEEQKKKGGYTVTDPETQLRTAQEAVQKRLQNQITDLELQIQTRQKIIKNPTKLQYDAKSNQLKARRDELKAVYDEIFAKPAKTEAERLAEWKERTKDRIDELKEFVAGTKQPKQRPSPVVLDKEALRIRFDLHTIERLWREKLAKEKRDQWTKWQKAKAIPAEVLNVSRALLTSFDFSAPGRQGIIIGLAHPIRASRALRPMFEAWRSEKGAFDAAEQIRNRDNAPLYEMGKLYLAEHGGRLSRQEEAYMSRWASKVPGIRASERAYVTFLNRLRADSFDSMVEGLTAKGVANPAELKAIANFINVATGRGVGLEKSGTTLNTIFFAPRFVASRFQFLAGQPLYKGTAATRKAIAKEYGKFLAGAAVVYALAQSAGAEVGTDPRSSDFGKIIIGNTRIDPMAGLNQVSTLVGRTVTGKSKPIKGRAYPIVGNVPYGKPDLLKVMMNFGRSKLTPSIGTAISLRTGKDVAGQPYSVTDLPKSMAVPISWQDIYSAIREEGVPAGIAMGMLSIFGLGVNTFEKQSKR